MEGPLKWWFFGQRIHCAIAEVEAALTNLVHKGFLVADQADSGGPFTDRTEPKNRRSAGILGKYKRRVGPVPNPLS
jgi:hypothetical protein